MDYQFREAITTIVTELQDGTLSIVKSPNHMTRLRVEEAPENGMRVFAHNGILYIKALIPKPAELQLYLPESVHELKLKANTADFILTELEMERISVTTSGDCSMHNVVATKECMMQVEGGDISLQECKLSSINVQLFNGSLETHSTALYGNNVIFTQDSDIGGHLRGALVDYVVSAGSGIDPDRVIVNDHPLTEFPDRKNTSEAAWLLIAGRNSGEIRFTMTRNER